MELRHAVKVVNQVLASLTLQKHPDKTFIGRIAKGFDWLEYRMSPGGLSVAAKTLQNCVARIRRLYEQSKEEPDDSSRLGDYMRRWVRWVRSLLPGTEVIHQLMYQWALQFLTVDAIRRESGSI